MNCKALLNIAIEIALYKYCIIIIIIITVLSAKSSIEANIPEFNVLTRIINNVYSNGTTESQIFTRAQQIVAILSNVVTSPFLTVTKLFQLFFESSIFLFQFFLVFNEFSKVLTSNISLASFTI